MRMDNAGTGEYLESFNNAVKRTRLWLDEHAALGFEDQAFREMYDGWCSDQYYVALARYTLDRDCSAFEEQVTKVVHDYIPLMQYKDYWAIDHFLEPFLVFVALKPNEEIVHVSEESSHNRFEYPTKINKWTRLLVKKRILGLFRSYFVQDRAWMEQELEYSKDLCINAEERTRQFRIPKKKWHPLFSSLFDKDEMTFTHNLLEIAKWYRTGTKKEFRAGYEYDYMYHQCINYIVLATLKIANAYQGMTVEIDDFFVPRELIRLC